MLTFEVCISVLFSIYPIVVTHDSDSGSTVTKRDAAAVHTANTRVIDQIDAGEALVDAEIIHEDSFTSMVEDGVGRDGDRVKPLVILATVAALTVLLVWCEHAPAGLDWLGELVRNRCPRALT